MNIFVHESILQYYLSYVQQDDLFPTVTYEIIYTATVLASNPLRASPIYLSRLVYRWADGSAKSNCREVSNSIGRRQIRESVPLLSWLCYLADLSIRGNRLMTARTAGSSVSKEAQGAVHYGRTEEDGEKGRRKQRGTI